MECEFELSGSDVESDKIGSILRSWPVENPSMGLCLAQALVFGIQKYLSAAFQQYSFLPLA